MRWGDGHSLTRGSMTPFTREDRTPAEHGVSGRAIRDGRASWTDDYLADESFGHDEASDEVVRKLGIRSVIAAPLVAEEVAIGAIGVYAETPGAFNSVDAELLGLLADQAAIVLTNARLNAEAEVTAEKLAHRVEAQRTLGEIAASITSIRDPSAVLSRAVAEAKRLLDAEHVVIHQVRSGTRELADYREVARRAGRCPAIDDSIVSIGQGIAGRAVASGSGRVDRRLPVGHLLRAHGARRRVDHALRVPLADERPAHRRLRAARRGQRLFDPPRRVRR